MSLTVCVVCVCWCWKDWESGTHTELGYNIIYNCSMVAELIPGFIVLSWYWTDQNQHAMVVLLSNDITELLSFFDIDQISTNLKLEKAMSSSALAKWLMSVERLLDKRLTIDWSVPNQVMWHIHVKTWKIRLPK